MNLRLLCIAVLILSLSTAAWAGDDGFDGAARMDGVHFTVYYKSGVSLESLAAQLKISKTDEVLTGQSIDTSSSSSQLAGQLEVLFQRASDVLDMRIASLKASIKVFATQGELTQWYNQLFHTDLPCTGFGFYLPDSNSIYISAEHFGREVLGHEMGHAVMSHYFVVQPSIKIQEVLAGYVEYQLRKSQ